MVVINSSFPHLPPTLPCPPHLLLFSSAHCCCCYITIITAIQQSSVIHTGFEFQPQLYLAFLILLHQDSDDLYFWAVSNHYTILKMAGMLYQTETNSPFSHSLITFECNQPTSNSYISKSVLDEQDSHLVMINMKSLLSGWLIQWGILPISHILPPVQMSSISHLFIQTTVSFPV